MFKTFITYKGHLTINLNHITYIEWEDKITVKLIDDNVVFLSRSEGAKLLKSLKELNENQLINKNPNLHE